MREIRHWGVVVIGSVVAALIGAGAGFGQEETTLSETVDEVWESAAASPFSSIAEEVTGGVRVEDIVEPPSEYRYAAFGKPDPFVPPIINSTRVDGQPVDSLEVPIISPLQRFDLSQLSIVGIYQLASGERKAMVLPSSSRETVIVRIGDPIGKRGGRVLSIGRDSLTVREFTLAVDGTREFEDKQLFLGNERAATVSGSLIFEPGRDEPILNLNKPLVNQQIPSQSPEGEEEGAEGATGPPGVNTQGLSDQINTLNQKIDDLTQPRAPAAPASAAPTAPTTPLEGVVNPLPGNTGNNDNSNVIPAGDRPAGDSDPNGGRGVANPSDPTNDSSTNGRS